MKSRNSLQHYSLIALGALLLSFIVGCSDSSSTDPEIAVLENSHSIEFDYDLYLKELQEDGSFRQITEFPETEIIRMVPYDEVLKTVVECLNDAGYNATYDPNSGGMTSPKNLPAEQYILYKTANYRCHAEYPGDPNSTPYSGEVQVRKYFDFYQNTLTPCLEAQGFKISAGPSWETFLSSWELSEYGYFATENSWHPYDSVDLFGSEELQGNFYCS